MTTDIDQLPDAKLADIKAAFRADFSKEFCLLARDLGYEVGATLKPSRKADLFTALADLNKLALSVNANSTNPALNGFLYGVIAALENPAQKPGQ